MPQGIVRAGFPRAIGAALLAGLLSLPLPAEARDPAAGRVSTLTQQSIIRDKDGFRAGRMDRKPDGDVILRDKNGFRSGRLDADSRGGYAVRDKNGFRAGRID